MEWGEGMRRRLRVVLALVVTGGVAACMASPASALPFHGYNAYQWPCAFQTDSVWPATSPNGCMGTTEFSWMQDKPVVYRMPVFENEWNKDGGLRYKQAI